MGATGSIAAARQLHFSKWTVTMVKEVHSTWQEHFEARFALTRNELSQLLAKCPTVQERLGGSLPKFIDDTWTIMAGTSKGLDACGLLAALAVMAEGMVEDKVTIVFDVFDFNKMERLTQDELTILFMATNASLARYSGQKITPSKSAKRCEALSKAAFSQTQADTHITAPQFAGFVSKFMKVFKNDGKRHLQPGLSPEEQEKYEGAATLIQALIRGRITRHEAARRAACAVSVQTLIRGWVARKRVGRVRAVLMEEATHAFDVDAGREGYSARRSSMIVSTSAVADGSAKDDEHKAAISHAQRLQLVRHALRSLYKADIESLAKIAKPEFPLLVLAGALCLVFKEPTTWASAQRLLRRPQFRSQAASLEPDEVPESAIPVVTKLFKDNSILEKIVTVHNRPGRVLLNWVGLLVGVDLPQHLQAHIREAAKENVKKKKAASKAAKAAKAAGAGSASDGKAGDGGSGAGAGSSSDTSAGAGNKSNTPPRKRSRSSKKPSQPTVHENGDETVVSHHGERHSGGHNRHSKPRHKKGHDDPMMLVPAAIVGRAATLASLERDRRFLAFSRAGSVAIVSSLPGDRSVHLQCTQALSRRSGVATAYFEVRVLDTGDRKHMAVGLAPRAYSDNRLVGWGTGSLAYHADSGKKLSGVGSLGTVEQAFGSAWRAGDVVGCGLNFEKKQIFFTLNGSMVGVAARSVAVSEEFWPTISLGEVGQAVAVNFGEQPFVHNPEAAARAGAATGAEADGPATHGTTTSSSSSSSSSRGSKGSKGNKKGSKGGASSRSTGGAGAGAGAGAASGSGSVGPSSRVKRMGVDKRFANTNPMLGNSMGGSVYLGVGGSKRATMVTL